MTQTITKSLPLSLKYRAITLDDIFGQEFIVNYFKKVVEIPEKAFKNYILLGEFGVGKTSIAKAFSNDLLKTVTDLNFFEIDSSEIQEESSFNYLKESMFLPIPGWKVVILDEIHLMPLSLQNKFLKVLEDNISNTFVFFCTTEKNGIANTLISRCLDFNLDLFTDNQSRQYLNKICKNENIKLSSKVEDIIILKARGHLRDIVNQIELVLFMGEEDYLSGYKDIVSYTMSYFESSDFSIIDKMMSFPVIYIKYYLEFFIYEKIIKNKKYFNDKSLYNFFSFYLKMKKYIQTDNDFYSFLFLLKEYFEPIKDSNNV